MHSLDDSSIFNNAIVLCQSLSLRFCQGKERLINVLSPKIGILGLNSIGEDTILV